MECCTTKENYLLNNNNIKLHPVSSVRKIIQKALPPHEDSSEEDDDSWREEEHPVTNSISTIEVGDCVGQMRVRTKNISTDFNDFNLFIENIISMHQVFYNICFV